VADVDAHAVRGHGVVDLVDDGGSLSFPSLPSGLRPPRTTCAPSASSRRLRSRLFALLSSPV